MLSSLCRGLVAWPRGGAQNASRLGGLRSSCSSSSPAAVRTGVTPPLRPRLRAARRGQGEQSGLSARGPVPALGPERFPAPSSNPPLYPPPFRRSRLYFFIPVGVVISSGRSCERTLGRVPAAPVFIFRRCKWPGTPELVRDGTNARTLAVPRGGGLREAAGPPRCGTLRQASPHGRGSPGSFCSAPSRLAHVEPFWHDRKPLFKQSC